MYAVHAHRCMCIFVLAASPTIHLDVWAALRTDELMLDDTEPEYCVEEEEAHEADAWAEAESHGKEGDAACQVKATRERHVRSSA